MTEIRDVVIIGAGPSGVSTAVRLARAGLDVTVIDKSRFPRDKTCGDGLTTAALRQLELLGFDPRSLPSWTQIHKTTWRSTSGHTIDLDVAPGGVRAAVVRRFELDAALVDLARSEGVDVIDGCTLQSAHASDNSVAITTTDEREFRAGYVIGADGIYSPLRRCLNGSRDTYLGDIHAFRQYFTNVTGPAADRLWVSFERDLLPGYVWSFPAGNNTVNIGFGVERRPGQSVRWMHDVWPDILGRDHVKAILGEGAQPESAHKAWPIPARLRHNTLTGARGRALFVGDAARSVDPLTGEGIGQALETGALAAESIIRGLVDVPGSVARTYKRAVAARLSVDHHFAAGLARIVRHDLGARAAIRMAPLGPQRGRYAIKWVFEEYPRAGLLTPWRWRERFATQSAPFTSAGDQVA